MSMLFINHTDILEGKAASVEISGPLDSETSSDFENYIDETLKRGIDFILLDAARLEYVSSEGIGVLILVQKKIVKRNGFFVIFNLSEEIASLFTILGFDKIFTAAASRIEAMEIMDRQIELRDIEPVPAPEKPGSTGDDTGMLTSALSGSSIPPFVIECRNCSSLVRVRKEGEHLCPDCGALFSVGADQKVSFSS